MGRREPRRDVLDVTREDTPPGDAARGGVRLDGASPRAVAEEERGRIEPARDEPREGLDDDVLPLQAVERAHVDEPKGRRRGRGVLEEGLVRKAVGDDDDLRRRDARPLRGTPRRRARRRGSAPPRGT